MLSKTELGRIGEQIAENFLTKNNYQIIARNFRLRNGEIDIIAIEPPQSGKSLDTSPFLRPGSKYPTLVFFEVKTRTSDDFGTPLEAITYFKLKALIRSAQVYKTSHKNLPDAMRIDALAIIVDPDGVLVSLEHVRNISA